MDSKGLESANTGRVSGTHGASSGASASSSANGGDRSWWQWTHGKSGSISSSSGDVASAPLMQYGQLSNAAESANNNSTQDASSSMAVPAWGTMRWEKRATRTGLLAREERGSAVVASTRSSSSPKFTASALSSSASPSTSMSRGSITAPKKKLVQSSIRASRDISVRKRFTSSSTSGLHDFSLPAPVKDARSPAVSLLDREMHTEIKWSLGPGKRKIVKKDKKVGRAISLQHPRSALSGAAHRPLRAWLDGNALPASEPSTNAGLGFAMDVNMLEDKSAQCASPISTASTISLTASQASSTSFGLADPVTTCARAILVDCYRERKSVESSGMRKRTLEGRTKLQKGSDPLLWSYPRDLSKSPADGGFSCGSSSSDDELKEVSRFGDISSDRDSDFKSTPEEERYRQIMLRAYDASSSPEVEIGSPLLEEKGLSAEMRYQLPLARGTANETDKECTICKTRYNIGDHICTLPCQHFFHYRCVDQWLCSHTSCPLCRWDVTADADMMEFNQKHQLTECSPSDREAFQRKMRSSTHSAGFRPVVPASEVDQLHQHLATLRLQEESAEVSDEHVKYLVCPTPQRPQRQ